MIDRGHPWAALSFSAEKRWPVFRCFEVDRAAYTAFGALVTAPGWLNGGCSCCLCYPGQRCRFRAATCWWVVGLLLLCVEVYRATSS